MSAPRRTLNDIVLDAVEHDHVIDHHAARLVAYRWGTPSTDGPLGAFVRTGQVPRRYAALLELHAELFAADPGQHLDYQAMARYLRLRHTTGCTGPEHTWSTLDHHALPSAA